MGDDGLRENLAARQQGRVADLRGVLQQRGHGIGSRKYDVFRYILNSQSFLECGAHESSKVKEYIELLVVHTAVAAIGAVVAQTSGTTQRAAH
jgi:hypothetical protein